LKVRSATYFELARSDLAPVLEDQRTVHHACEVETSLMLVLAPELVKPDRLREAFGGVADANAGEKQSAVPARFRSFKEFTPSGVNGDARRANREKGEKLVAICVEGVAAALRNTKIWD
jgi:creatinine amidohydrolase